MLNEILTKTHKIYFVCILCTSAIMASCTLFIYTSCRMELSAMNFASNHLQTYLTNCYMPRLAVPSRGRYIKVNYSLIQCRITIFFYMIRFSSLLAHSFTNLIRQSLAHNSFDYAWILYTSWIRVGQSFKAGQPFCRTIITVKVIILRAIFEVVPHATCAYNVSSQCNYKITHSLSVRVECRISRW